MTYFSRMAPPRSVVYFPPRGERWVRRPRTRKFDPNEPTPDELPIDASAYSKLRVFRPPGYTGRGILVGMSSDYEAPAGVIDFDLLEALGDRQPGLGRAALQYVTDLADKYDVTLRLTATPLAKEGSTAIPFEKLKALYSEFGFEVYKESTVAARMRRNPGSA